MTSMEAAEKAWSVTHTKTALLVRVRSGSPLMEYSLSLNNWATRDVLPKEDPQTLILDA